MNSLKHILINFKTSIIIKHISFYISLSPKFLLGRTPVLFFSRNNPNQLYGSLVKDLEIVNSKFSALSTYSKFSALSTCIDKISL